MLERGYNAIGQDGPDEFPGIVRISPLLQGRKRVECIRRKLGAESVASKMRELGNTASCPLLVHLTDSLPAAARRGAGHPDGGPLNSHATATPPNPTRGKISLEQAIQCAHRRKKIAGTSSSWTVRGITPIFDFFILLTGGSRRQLHTLAEEIDAYMRLAGRRA